MKKLKDKNQSSYIYDEQGVEQVSEQITNSYNSGAIDYGQKDDDDVKGE